MAEIAGMAEKSGKSGRIFSGSFCRYDFASVFPFPASVPGSGDLATTVNSDRLMPVSWRLGSGCRVWRLGSA